MFNNFTVKWKKNVQCFYLKKHILKPYRDLTVYKFNSNTIQRYIFIELIQIKHDAYHLSLYEEKDRQLTFINKKYFEKITNNIVNLHALFSFIRMHTTINKFNFMFTIHNVKFLSNYRRIIGLMFEEISKFKNNEMFVIFTKPNYFYMYFQTKKIKSVKKSRKKMLYTLKKKIKAIVEC